MKAPVYIYVSTDKRKSKPTLKVRASASPVAVQSGEIEVKFNMEIPDEMFTQPDLEANIVVKRDASAIPSLTIKANAVSDWLKK